MSSRWYRIGAGIVLGLGGLSIATTADDSQPAGRDASARSATSASAAEEKTLVANSTRDRRVIVRDLREGVEQVQCTPAQRSRYGYPWMRGIDGDASYYLPYGGYYGYGWSGSVDWWEGAYRAMRRAERKEQEREFNRRDMAERKQRVLDQHEQAVLAGLRQLKEGQPERATVAFTLAAKLNQGDPACRIHLAQARLAQGHYAEAGMALRRALELQPKLVYADLRLREYYRAADEFDGYVDRLAKWVSENDEHPEVCFLLGFLEFQRGDFGAAHAAFERVRRVRPNDALTLEYLSITKRSRE